MKTRWRIVVGGGLLVFSWLGCVSESMPTGEGKSMVDWPALPSPVSNNAVASIEMDGKSYLFSFNGLGPGKTWRDVGSLAFQYEVGGDAWTTLDDVPGGEGRLASVAVGVGDGVFIFGGYTVAEDGAEKSTSWVHRYDPVARSYEERSPMPVSVDDSVSLIYRSRYIYLVSGWHDTDNVNLVQVYDTETDQWFEATPYPGAALFGHAGGIVGNRMVIADGTRVVAGETDRRLRFAISDECYLGSIDMENPARIDWKALPAHPGAPLYRMAFVGIDSGGERVVFAGGSDNPYKYDGLGYSGVPSEPSPRIFAFNLDREEWEEPFWESNPRINRARAQAPITGNPSRLAASLKRSSRLTNSSVAGSRSDATTAAAS